jgi:hypothetical protein
MVIQNMKVMYATANTEQSEILPVCFQSSEYSSYSTRETFILLHSTITNWVVVNF